MGSLSEIPMHKQGISRSCSYENPSGEKGKAGMAASPLGPGRKGAPFLKNLLVGSTAVLADIDGPGVLKHFFITVTDDGGEDSTVHRDLLFRIYWEGETEPAVECPLGDFFCCGEGQINNDIPLPVTVVPARGLHCYFPMPFRKHIKITLENRYKETIFIVAWQADFLLDTHFTDEIAYFHAAWNQISFFPGQAIMWEDIFAVSGRKNDSGRLL